MIEANLMSGNRSFNPQAYQEFLDWISFKGIAVTPTGSNRIITSTNARVAYDFSANDVSTMWGSSFGTYLTTDSGVGYAVCHAFPTQAEFNDFVTSKRRVVYKARTLGTVGLFSALLRNGYQSASYGAFSGAAMEEFIYWSVVNQTTMSYNPSLGGQPQPFDLV